MSSRKNVVLVTPGFPKDEDDHLCMPYVQEYLIHMLENHPEVQFNVVAVQYPPKRKNYRWNGISVTACGGDNNRFPARLMTWRKVLKTLDRIHRESPIDTIHSLWLNECTYLAHRWSKKNKVRMLATAMGQDVLSGNRYLSRLKLDQIATVAVSNWQNDQLINSTGNPADYVIPWGIDALKPSPDERDIDVLGVGSFTKLKDYQCFLKVVKSIKDSMPDFTVLLVGYGPEESHLKRQAGELGLNKTVTFTGEMPRPQVLACMKRSKVLLHPSKYESQGFVFNEALSSGMAIVSREVGIAAKSERWRIEDSVESMADALSQLLDKRFEPFAIQSLEATAKSYLKIL